MANKRTLRKHISYACGELAAECIMASNLVKGADSDKFDSLVIKIAKLQARTMQHINVVFDKVPRDFSDGKAYRHERNAYFRAAYRALLEGFDKEIKEIVDQMNSALPKKA